MAKPKLRMKEGALSTNEFVMEDTERIKLEKEAFDNKGVIYAEKDRPFNDKERRFEYYRNLNPKSFKQHVRGVFRLLDERDGKEYIVIYAIKECSQKLVTEDGKEMLKPHTIDGYWGFYDDPTVEPKEFNPDGTVKDAIVTGLERRYYIPWSKEKLFEIINDPANHSTTTQFYMGIASKDPSSDNAQPGTKYLIRNSNDFANHDFETVLRLARSRLSSTEESMGQISQTLALRKRLGTSIVDAPPQSVTTTVKPKVEKQKTDISEPSAQA